MGTMEMTPEPTYIQLGIERILNQKSPNTQMDRFYGSKLRGLGVVTVKRGREHEF